MIGIDRRTGKTLSAYAQLVSRVTQVMTTPLGAREKRHTFGSRVRLVLGENMTDATLIRAQTAALEAFHNPVNGISDFSPTRVVATRGAVGVTLHFAGIWQGKIIAFEVPNVTRTESTLAA